MNDFIACMLVLQLFFLNISLGEIKSAIKERNKY